jgi:hypothetical protein
MLPPVGPDVKAWAEDIRRWLARSWDALTYRQATSNATQDGLIMWDTAGYPVVSKSGEWKAVVIEGMGLSGTFDIDDGEYPATGTFTIDDGDYTP